MRVPTGSTDRYMYFVAVDATDLKTRETTLTGFSVFYSLNGAAETAYTTPTTTEIDATNCPGVYALLLDEGNTLNSAHDEAEMMIHITHASMAPVTRTYELFRPKMTEGQTATVANGAVDADIERLQGSAIATPTVAGVLEVDVTHWLGTAAATPTTAGVPEVDVTFWLGGAVATPTITGVPEVDITHLLGTAWLAPGTAGTPDVNVKLWNALTTVALPLVPTTAGRTLDVSVGGEAGLDWANIGSPTTAQNLSATNIDVDQIVASVSGAVGSVTGAVGSVAAGGITAASIANAAIDAATFAADVDAEIRSYLGLAAADLDTQLAALPTAAENADAVLDEDMTAHQTLGSLGQAIGDPVADSNTIYGAVVTGAAGATVAADIIAVKAETASLQTDTDDIQTRLPAALVGGRIDASVGAMAANVITAASMNADASAEIADAVWDEAQADHVGVGTFGITASELADVLVDTAEIGAAGAGLTNINLPNQTMDIVGNITGNLSGSVGSVTGAVGSVAAGGIVAASFGAGAIDAAALAADAGTEIAAAVFAHSDESLTFNEWRRVVLGAAAGKADGLAGVTVHYRNQADTKNRITATVDADGNRTAVTLDAT